MRSDNVINFPDPKKERTLTFDEVTNWKLNELKNAANDLSLWPEIYADLEAEIEKLTLIKAIAEDFIDWIEGQQ